MNKRTGIFWVVSFSLNQNRILCGSEPRLEPATLILAQFQLQLVTDWAASLWFGGSRTLPDLIRSGGGGCLREAALFHLLLFFHIQSLPEFSQQHLKTTGSFGGSAHSLLSAPPTFFLLFAHTLSAQRSGSRPGL